MDKISNHIVKLISAYAANEINKNQFNDLKKWLNEAPENQKIFIDYLLFYKKSQRIGFIDSLNVDAAWATVVSQFQRPIDGTAKNLKGRLRILKPTSKVIKYAAVVVLFFGFVFFYQNFYLSRHSEILSSSENITLQLEDGSLEIINLDTSFNIIDPNGNVIGSQSGSQLVYTNQISEETIAYNTLTVPYGKCFQVILSDGTKVDLNAGTSLKYPVKFGKGKNREVFLNGEAYFDVKKDTAHPFVVNANDINIRVLGTRFNLSSYLEDRVINTVLVEGSISIYDQNATYKPETSTLLEPGYKASWDKNKQIIAIEEADIEMHTAWINGRIIFRHVPFNDIIKKLERKYNVTIQNNNEDLGKDIISASFDIETIDQVFSYINEIHPIDYAIKDNTVIIN
ncbi:FecR family protein [Arenibacter nanhaiticus]|uniref:FecR family protein n=1 Tax=Arenibacter nanhaiticus TaxID=558155 RepID=A0A1M6CAJ9_9FLAO|nr:FecR domain-containing protein [Arenibacter nanhaiticus]SHI58065.1 FecR family protein [Arenibacter nanhaiticus]